MTSIPEFQTRFCFHIERDPADEFLLFYLDRNEVIRMYHQQDCCESVYLADVNGNLSATNFLIYECIEKCDENPPERSTSSATWTFYTFRTSSGYIDLRWIGESNGYYSESVDLSTKCWESPPIPVDIVAKYPEAFI